MDSQQTLLEFSKLSGPDLTSERNVESPLVQGAKIFCACGCGKERMKYDSKGRERRYIYGHMCKEFGFSKGNKPWNKEMAGKYPTQMRENMRRAHLGVPLSKQHKENIGKANKGIPNPLKGKTYEEIHGVYKAKIRKENMSRRWKGKTYEEIYGEERARVIKERHRESALRMEVVREYKTPLKQARNIKPINRDLLSKCFHFLFPKICKCGCGEKIKWKYYGQYTSVQFVRPHQNHIRTGTFEELYGQQKAKEIKEKLRKRLKGKTYIELYGEENARIRIENHIKRTKGKTFEELYGEKRAKELKQKFSKGMINRSFIDRFGEKKAKEVLKKRSKALKGKSYEQLYGKEKAEKLKAKKREWRSKLIFPNKDNKIELKIQNYLKQLGISFFTHQYLNQIEHAYQCDIWVPAMNLVLEVDGDYWHANPDRFKDEDLDERQRLQKEKDVIRTSELIEKGFKVLRLWEKEIKSMDINEFKERLHHS